MADIGIQLGKLVSKSPTVVWTGLYGGVQARMIVVDVEYKKNVLPVFVFETLTHEDSFGVTSWTRRYEVPGY